MNTKYEPVNIKTDNNDSEYEEEELYIYADFQNKLPFETLADPNLKIKIIGIDTAEPIFQINSKMFEGSFDYAMGTQLFFQESTNDNSTTDENSIYQTTVPNQLYEYINKTNKIIKMNRIFVEPKDGSTDISTTKDSGGGAGSENNVAIILKPENSEPPIVLTKSYCDALNQLLRPGEAPPRSLDEEDKAFFLKYSQIDKLNMDEQNEHDSDNKDIDRSSDERRHCEGGGGSDEPMPSVSSLNLSKK